MTSMTGVRAAVRDREGAAHWEAIAERTVGTTPALDALDRWIERLFPGSA